MNPSAPPIHNIYPTIPPGKSPEMIPQYPDPPPYSAQVPQPPYYPQQQNFPYPQQQPGNYPNMQPPVAAPRHHSVDLGNTQILQQTVINTEVNLGTEIIKKL